jgi:hypothetical protein
MLRSSLQIACLLHQAGALVFSVIAIPCRRPALPWSCRLLRGLQLQRLPTPPLPQLVQLVSDSEYAGSRASQLYTGCYSQCMWLHDPRALHPFLASLPGCIQPAEEAAICLALVYADIERRPMFPYLLHHVDSPEAN